MCFILEESVNHFALLSFGHPLEVEPVFKQDQLGLHVLSLLQAK
jgi:hypothetical protein